MTTKLSTIIKNKATDPKDETLKDFEKYAQNNEIDWDEFLTGKTNWFYLYRMAKKEYGIEYLIKYDKVDALIHMIRCDKGQQYYEQLKNHKIYGVRVALAKKGYFPDEFIQDTNDYVKIAVVEKHPEHLDHVLHLHDFENTITRVICEYENINYETLKTYKNKYDTKRLLPEYVTALNLKLAGLKDQTALTKTMTVEQLFMTGNPTWTRPYSLNQIVRLNELAEKVGHENMNVIAQYFKITPNWKDEITDKIWELA